MASWRTQHYRQRVDRRADASNATVMAIRRQLGDKSSPLEKRFLWGWKVIHGPELVCEFQFHPSRKWRFDFAHSDSRVAVEIEGGTWVAGRHTTGTGFERDCEKYNEAAFLGWVVFRLTQEMLTFANLGRIRAFIDHRHYVDGCLKEGQ